MTDRPVQNDFGGFDTRFLGITLQMEPRSWALLQRCNMLGRDPAEVVALGNQALRGGEAEAFELFSIATVMIHELRHFHDFLLSPYGSSILRARMTGIMNGHRAIGLLKKNVSLVPVPLSRWRRLGPARQAALLEEWSGLVPGPHRGLDLLLSDESLLVETEKCYAHIVTLVVADRGKDEPDFQPCHVLEASAIAVQATNVYAVFGRPHSELFLNHLLQSPRLKRYARVVNVWRMLARDEPIDTAVLAAAVTWCLLGDYASEGWQACPTRRFARLVDHLWRHGLPQQGRGLGALLDQWSDHLGKPRVSDALRSTQRRNRELARQLAAIPKPVRVALEPVLTTYDAFLEAQARLIKAFEADRDSYLRPDLYAEMTASLPAAPIRVDFRRGVLVDRETRLKQHWSILEGRRSADGQVALRSGVLRHQTQGHDIFEPEKTSVAASIMTMSEFVFSDLRRDDPDFDTARDLMLESQPIALEILD